MSKSLALDLVSKRKRNRSDYVFHQDYRTRWADNDMFSHLNNPIYGVLIDSVINAYLFAHCGYHPSTSARVGLVASTYCDYFGSTQYPAVLDVGLRVVRMGKSSVMYECGIFERGDKGVKAVGGFVQIWVPKEGMKADGQGIDGKTRVALEGLMK
ncbi:Thioesterase/thiol ester dehydrase-isomerase, partial [Polychaeton citri CBS 116435]